MKQKKRLFVFVFDFFGGGRDPLHVARAIEAVAFEGDNVVNLITGAAGWVAAQPHKLPARGGAAQDMSGGFAPLDLMGKMLVILRKL